MINENNDDGVVYGLGVDIHSDFTFENGDLKLSKYEDNLVQAIVNRLNTRLDELELFYTDYGSVLTGFLGWKAEDKTLQYIETEIGTVLVDEPRISNLDITVNYDRDGRVRINLTLYTISDDVVETNLVLGVNGVEVSSENDEDVDLNEEEI